MPQDINVISPAEIAADILTRLGPPDLAPAGVVVGPANDQQQQAGIVQLVPAGLPVLEKYSPVQHMRAQMRCLAGTLAVADEIAQKVYAEMNGRTRTVAYMASIGQRYLVHRINITAGPSAHYDSPETHEMLVFAELMIGTTPISS